MAVRRRAESVCGRRLVVATTAKGFALEGVITGIANRENTVLNGLVVQNANSVGGATRVIILGRERLVMGLSAIEHPTDMRLTLPLAS